MTKFKNKPSGTSDTKNKWKQADNSILGRKAKRKADKKNAKINKALNYAKTKQTKKVCVSASDAKFVQKTLNNSGIGAALSGKVCALDKGGIEFDKIKRRKRVKKKKKKNNVTVKENCSDKESEEDDTSSFKVMNKTNNRLEQLKQYVERESKGSVDIEKQKTNKKSDKLKQNSLNLIKDKDKLNDLQEGKIKDQKEINQLASSLKMSSKQKRNFNNIFQDDFGSLIDDIEQRVMTNSHTYGESKMLNSDDEFEEDVKMVLGSGVFKKKKKKEDTNSQKLRSGESDLEENDPDGNDSDENDSEENYSNEYDSDEKQNVDELSSDEIELDNSTVLSDEEQSEEESSDADSKEVVNLKHKDKRKLKLHNNKVSQERDRHEQLQIDMIKDQNEINRLANSLDVDSKSNGKLNKMFKNTFGEDFTDNNDIDSPSEETLSENDIDLSGSDAGDDLELDISDDGVDDDSDNTEDDDDSDSDSGFLDREAIEDNDESSDNLISENEEDILFEGGGCLSSSIYQGPVTSLGHPKNIFDLYQDKDSEHSSDNEEDEDLEGFVCDNDEVEYDTDQSDDFPEELEDGRLVAKSKKVSKLKKTKRKRILSLESADSDSVANQETDRKEFKRPSDLKRKRLTSETSDLQSSDTEKESSIQEKLTARKVSVIDDSSDESPPVSISPSQSPIKSKKKRKRRKDKIAIGVNNTIVNQNSSPIKNSEVIYSQNQTVPNNPGTNVTSAVPGNLELASTKILKKKKKKDKNKKVTFTDNVNVTAETLISNDHNDMNREKDENHEIHEDIYGRLRDKDGKVITSNQANHTTAGIKYIPPAMRKLMELNSGEDTKKKLEELYRKLKGLLNRLAESNLSFIVGQIESNYNKNSRNDMNDTITKLFMSALVTPVLMNERLVQEHALLIAILSANIDMEVGAHILTEFIVRWSDELKAYDPLGNHAGSKVLDNLLLFVTHLYNFKVVDSSLVYDILLRLAQNFQTKEIELILLVLRSVGFTLRKDDPSALKQLISCIQTKAADFNVTRDNGEMHDNENKGYPGSQDKMKKQDKAGKKHTGNKKRDEGDNGSQGNGETFTRVKFMLEILIALRNNNVSKMPNYDPSHVIHLRLLMKNIVRKGCSVTPLKVSLEDLLMSRTAGKWWLVGSAWSGGLKEETSIDKLGGTNVNISTQKQILFDESWCSEQFKMKAEKLHISRPPRIVIFYILTEGSENVGEAFDKLLRLKLPTNQEHEIFSIMLLCLMKGTNYNFFFACLANKFCHFDRKFKFKLQKCIWDKFTDISSIKPKKLSHLSKFLADLIAEGGLPLTTIGSDMFLSAEKCTVSFIRQTLISLLLHSQGISAITSSFKVLLNPKFSSLRQCFRLFLKKFINTKDADDEKIKMLAKRKEIALNLISSADGPVL